jgi:hypothetical protein
MTRRFLALVLLSGILAGCSDYNPPAMKDPVDIRGKVTMRGASVGDVMLVLQPTERGYQTNLQLATDGSFAGQAVPGKYMYYFQPIAPKSPGDQSRYAGAFRRVPEFNRSPNLSNIVEVSAGDVAIEVK